MEGLGIFSNFLLWNPRQLRRQSQSWLKPLTPTHVLVVITNEAFFSISRESYHPFALFHHLHPPPLREGTRRQSRNQKCPIIVTTGRPEVEIRRRAVTGRCRDSATSPGCAGTASTLACSDTSAGRWSGHARFWTTWECTRPAGGLRAMTNSRRNRPTLSADREKRCGIIYCNIAVLAAVVTEAAKRMNLTEKLHNKLCYHCSILNVFFHTYIYLLHMSNKTTY